MPRGEISSQRRSLKKFREFDERLDAFGGSRNRVAYANDGVDLYFCCDRASQKARNLGRSSKVSLTIDRDTRDWDRIKGLSMGARARVLSKPGEVTRAFGLLARKFPEMRKMSKEDLADTAFVKVTPKVISVLDYSKGFGHTELVRP